MINLGFGNAGGAAYRASQPLRLDSEYYKSFHLFSETEVTKSSMCVTVDWHCYVGATAQLCPSRLWELFTDSTVIMFQQPVTASWHRRGEREQDYNSSNSEEQL